MQSEDQKHAAYRVGSIIDGKYEILSKVGCGGFGTVFRAYQRQLDRTVAVKVLPPLAEGESAARFEREAAAINALKHRNIILFYGFGFDNQTPYMVMEYVPGDSLESELEEHGPMPAKQALEIIKQICEALACAHANGVVHRDLKPSNIMLTDGESVEAPRTAKLIDFGLAKTLPAFGKDQQNLTQEGVAVGTVLYMSPEQCTGEAVDHRSDIYAIGCILYHCLSGLPPFYEENSIAIMCQHVNTAAKPLAELDSRIDCPPGTQELLTKAMAKRPADRYSNASELLADLEQLLADNSKVSTANKATHAVRRIARQEIQGLRLAAALFILVVASGCALWFALQAANTDNPNTSSLAGYTYIMHRVKDQSHPPDPAKLAAILETALQNDSNDKLLDTAKRINAYETLATLYLNSDQPQKACDSIEHCLRLVDETRALPDNRVFNMFGHWAIATNALGSQPSVATKMGKFLTGHPTIQKYDRDRNSAFLEAAQLWQNAGQPNQCVGHIKITDSGEVMYPAYRCTLRTECHNSRGEYDRVLDYCHLALRDPHYKEFAPMLHLQEMRALIGLSRWDEAHQLASTYSGGPKDELPDSLQMIFDAHEGLFDEANRLYADTLRSVDKKPTRYFQWSLDVDMRLYADQLQAAGKTNEALDVIKKDAALQQLARSKMI